MKIPMSLPLALIIGMCPLGLAAQYRMLDIEPTLRMKLEKRKDLIEGGSQCLNGTQKYNSIAAKYNGIVYHLYVNDSREVIFIMTYDQNFISPDLLLMGTSLNVICMLYPDFVKANEDGSYSVLLPSGWCAILFLHQHAGCPWEDKDGNPTIHYFVKQDPSYCPSDHPSCGA